MNKVTIICEECEKSFDVSPSRAKRARYCCAACRVNAMRVRFQGSENPSYKGGPQTLPCDWCGELVVRAPSSRCKYQHTFCSRECYGHWRSANIKGEAHPLYTGKLVTECAQCGAKLERHPHRFEVAERHYCDLTCLSQWQSEHVKGPAHHQWLGGERHRYGPDWPVQQELARARDRGVCRICGKTAEEQGRALDVHHVVPFRESHNNALDNLVCLCRGCHPRVEKGSLQLADWLPAEVLDPVGQTTMAEELFCHVDAVGKLP